MAEEPIALDRAGFLRLRKALEYIESMMASPGPATQGAPRPGAAPRPSQAVNVSSSTADGTTGYYTAKWQLYDASAKTWNDRADCWAMGPNGETLQITRYEGAQFRGIASDGKAIFCTAGSAAPSGFSGTLRVCEDDGNLHTWIFVNGVLTSHT